MGILLEFISRRRGKKRERERYRGYEIERERKERKTHGVYAVMQRTEIRLVAVQWHHGIILLEFISRRRGEGKV
jgi:hypothetical protein